MTDVQSTSSGAQLPLPPWGRPRLLGYGIDMAHIFIADLKNPDEAR